MESSSTSRNQPFIIKRNLAKTLVPEESKVFDEDAERHVRFIQGANAFVMIGFGYESVKQIYYHFQYSDTCEDFSYFLLALVANNILWIIWAYYCHGAVNSRRSATIKKHMWLITVLLILRIAMYITMYSVMGTAVINSEKYYCDVVYQSAIYIFQGTIETVFMIILIFLMNSIRKYVLSTFFPLIPGDLWSFVAWEQSTQAALTSPTYRPPNA